MVFFTSVLFCSIAFGHFRSIGSLIYTNSLNVDTFHFVSQNNVC